MGLSYQCDSWSRRKASRKGEVLRKRTAVIWVYGYSTSARLGSVKISQGCSHTLGRKNLACWRESWREKKSKVWADRQVIARSNRKGYSIRRWLTANTNLGPPAPTSSTTTTTTRSRPRTATAIEFGEIIFTIKRISPSSSNLISKRLRARMASSKKPSRCT